MSVRYETLFAGNVPVGGMNLDVDCEGMGIAPLGANNGAGGISVIYDNSLGAGHDDQLHLSVSLLIFILRLQTNQACNQSLRMRYVRRYCRLLVCVFQSLHFDLQFCHTAFPDWVIKSCLLAR